MLKCISQPQLEKFGRADSGCSCSCDSNDGGASPSSATMAAEDELCRRPSTCGLRSAAGSTACLKDCVLGSLTKDSGSGVGLDSKIEQAMDLVKGHLMFAVREEVEVLKEQIKNLVARNGQLERENAFLRQYASPETLAKLQTVKKAQAPISSGFTA